MPSDCFCLVAKSCPALWGSPLPGSSGLSQARILEWVAISFSMGYSQPRDQIRVSCIGRKFPYHWATRETCPLVNNFLFLPSSATTTLKPLFDYLNLTILNTSYVKQNHMVFSFCDWVILLSIMSAGCIHVVTYNSSALGLVSGDFFLLNTFAWFSIFLDSLCWCLLMRQSRHLFCFHELASYRRRLPPISPARDSGDFYQLFPSPRRSRQLWFLSVCTMLSQGFPGGTVVKNPPPKAGDKRDTGSIPGSGRSPGGGNSNPLQYSCLENPMDRGAWRATVHGNMKSQTGLSMHAHCAERGVNP